MDLLPDELLLMIFEMLPINDTMSLCPRVCRRWKKLVDSRSLIIQAKGDTSRLNRCFRSVLVLWRMDGLSLQLFTKRLAHYSPLLRSLTVHEMYSFTNKDIENLANFPNLEHLDIFPRALCGSELAPVALKLKSIVFNKSILAPLLSDLAANSQLTEIHMYGKALSYDNNLLRTVLQSRAEHLRDLTLRCTKLDSHNYKQIGECLNLTSLRLYSCWLMSGKEILYTTKPRKLHTLHISSARLVNTHALKKFLENLQQCVVELVLSGSCFGDPHIPVLHKRNSSLLLLELWRTNVTPDGIVSLALSLPLLKVLDVDLKLSTQHMKTLQMHPSLKTLRCSSEMFQCFKRKDGCNAYQYKWRVVDNGEQFPAINNTPKTIKYDNLKFIFIRTSFLNQYFRLGFNQGLAAWDGFRGSLFYFWTRDRVVTPFYLPYKIPPIAPP